MEKKLVLKTDFFDFYDMWFDKAYGKEEHDFFLRYEKSGMNRIEMLNYLQFLNYSVPEHGLVKNLYLDNNDMIVIYLDINSHKAMDKILCSFQHAKDFYPVNYSSKYIYTDGIISYRSLRIGSKTFFLKYKSKHIWLSNYGDVDITIINDQEICIKNILPERSLLAVDFVKSVNDNKYYAIDINIAPGLTWTGIENILTAKEIYNEIKKYHFDNQKSLK